MSGTLRQASRLRRALVGPFLLLVCLLSVIATGEELHSAFELYQASRRDVGVSRGVGDLSSRLESLRSLLPRSGVVGYVSDGMQGESFTSASAMADYYDTQYALAPLIVVIGAGQPLVVANFSGSVRPTPRRLIPPDYRVIHDQGDGILLLERER